MLNKFCGFNDISKELADTIPPLKGIQTFQMLTGQKNIDPDPAYMQKYPILYPVQQIPSKDSVWDSGKNAFVPIALGHASFNDKGENIPQFDLIMPGMGLMWWRFSGKFSLNESIAEDHQKWAYLYLSNYNNKKVNRSISKDALFELIDIKENSRKDLEDIDSLTETLIYCKSMEVDEAIEIAASLNFPYNADKDIVFAAVKKYAKENPVTFLQLVKDPITELKATLKQAFDKGILAYDTNNGRIIMGNETIVGFNAHPIGFDYLTAFANWTKEVKNGASVVEGIRKKLNKKPKATEVV